MGPGQAMRGRPGPGWGQGREGVLIKNYESAADNLVFRMDQLGLAKAVILPPPQSPNQRGAYTYQELLGAVHRYPDRLVLAAGGGELSPMIFGTSPDQVTPEIKEEFRNRAGQIVRDGAHAFGEMAVLHYSFQRNHVFEQAPADHPLFLLLADLAAEYDIPIDIHMEAVLEDEPTSEALLNVSPNNPAITKATIPAFERLLRHNPNARIVWTHVGWDNTGHLTVELLRRLLKEHPNLYGAIKFVRQQYESFGKGNKVLDEPGMTIHPAWLDLMMEFPDRLMIGADEFIGVDNSTRRGPPSFQDTWSIVTQLPEELRQKVGGQNAARVYRL